MKNKKKERPNAPKPLDLGRLRKDLSLIMDEIDRSHGVLPDYYSPVMWQRLQETAERVANAIQAVRMKLTNKSLTVHEIASKLGLGYMQVAGYLAWNTMLDPNWVKPSIAVETVACPCGAPKGRYCNPVMKRMCHARRQVYIDAGRPDPTGKAVA